MATFFARSHSSTYKPMNTLFSLQYLITIWALLARVSLAKDYTVGWNCQSSNYTWGAKCGNTMTLSFSYLESVNGSYLPDDGQISRKYSYSTPACFIGNSVRKIEDIPSRDPSLYAMLHERNPLPRVICNNSFKIDFIGYIRHDQLITNTTYSDQNDIAKCLTNALQIPSCQIQFTSHDQQRADTITALIIMFSIFGAISLVGSAGVTIMHCQKRIKNSAPPDAEALLRDSIRPPSYGSIDPSSEPPGYSSINNSTTIGM